MKRKNGIKILIITAVLAFTLCATFLGVSCKDKVIENNVILQLNKTQMNLVIGDSEQLEATYKNGGNEVVTFTSSNENVVTVNRGGVITAINTGEATVQASYAGKTATCQVTVGLGEFVPVLEMTAIKNNQVTVSMIDEVNLDGVVSYNGKNYEDCTLTYALSDSTMAEIVDGKLKPLKTGDLTVTVSATWRGVSPEQQDTLNVSVAVKIIDSVQFFVNGDMTDCIKLYSLGSWGGQTFSNSMPFSITALINGKEIQTNVSIDGSEYVTLENGVLTAIKPGKTQVEFTCNDGQKEYAITLPVEIARPIAKYAQKITDFSFVEGEFDVSAIFGESVTLTDAYQDGEQVQVDNNKLVNLKSSNSEKTKSVITICTEKAGFELDVEGYTRVIDTEEEMKAFIVNNGDRATVTGYNFLAVDLTVSVADAVGWKDRYFKDGVLDGNGHTLNITMGTSWSFGVFGQMTNATVKNLNLNVIESNKYGQSNNNVNAVLAHLANNSTFENLSIQIKGSVSQPINKLFLIRSDQIEGTFTNVVVNIDDGIMAENATVYGMDSYSSSCYVFASPVVDSTGEKFVSYASVETAVDNSETFAKLINSGWWIFDQENDMLVWKPLVDQKVILTVADVEGDKFDATMQSNLAVKAKYFDLTLTPTLTVLDGGDVVTVNGNTIITGNTVGSATIKATFVASGLTIERVFTVVIGYEDYAEGTIIVSAINKKAYLPDGLTPVKITDADGVVYYENGAWDWTKLVAPNTYEIGKKVLYVQTAQNVWSVQTEIYMGVITNEEDFKYFASAATKYTQNLLVDSTQYSGGKARTGYWILANDITVNDSNWTDDFMYNFRYYQNATFDGNGHTLTIYMGSPWRFGIFGRSYELLVKNVHFDIRVNNAKLSGNTNTSVIFGDDMRNSAIVDSWIEIKATDTIATPVSQFKFMTMYSTNICLKNCVINIGDGILAENAAIQQMAGNWVVHGTQIDTQNNYFFTSVAGVTANNCFVAKQVSEITSTNSWRYTFTEFLKSEWWAYNEQTQTLTFGKKVS